MNPLPLSTFPITPSIGDEVPTLNTMAPEAIHVAATNTSLPPGFAPIPPIRRERNLNPCGSCSLSKIRVSLLVHFVWRMEYLTLDSATYSIPTVSFCVKLVRRKDTHFVLSLPQGFLGRGRNRSLA